MQPKTSLDKWESQGHKIVTKMYADVEGTVEGIKENVVEDKEPRRVAAAKSQSFMERRKAGRTEEAPSADKRYAEMIERRVREAKANRERGEVTNETEN